MSTRLFACLWLLLATLACDAGRRQHNDATAPLPGSAAPQHSPQAHNTQAHNKQAHNTQARRPLSSSARPRLGAPPHRSATTPAPASSATAHVSQVVVRYTAGAQPQQTLPMLVVIHGLGDRPDNFIRVYEALPYPLRIVAPQAFAPYHSGFSWFPVRLTPERATARAQDVKASTDKLASWLATLPATYPTTGKPLVSGFSQGGMLTFAMLAYHPDKIAAAFPIGGALDAYELPAQAPANAPRLWAFHGEQDPLVRFQPTASLIETMNKRGYAAELHAYPKLGHSISRSLRADLYAALQKALPPAKPSDEHQ